MIADIRLRHFRSYSDETFEFSPGVNIVVGPNASGKTNLLEALLVVALGKSYRARDAELIAFREPWARIDAHVDDMERIVKLEHKAGRFTKSFTIHNQTLTRLSLQRTLPVVVFEPNHLQLLIGSPELRRSYLDDILEQTVPGYGATRQHYRRVLSQRNSLLKKGLEIAKPQLFVWNLRLSELGGQIAEQRLLLIQQFNERLGPLYGELSQSHTQAEIIYQSNLKPDVYASQLLHKLEMHTELDCLRGFTADGPHRDDMAITVGGHPAELSASRGETRTVLLALKILELGIIETIRGFPPLLLLDDVFSELDGARRRALTEHLQNYQTFITTTDADVVVQHFMDKCLIIPTGS